MKNYIFYLFMYQLREGEKERKRERGKETERYAKILPFYEATGTFIQIFGIDHPGKEKIIILFHV